MGMEPFSDEARMSIVFAREEAKALGSNSIGPEHLLMGLAANSKSTVSDILEKHGLTLELLHNFAFEHCEADDAINKDLEGCENLSVTSIDNIVVK